MDTSKNPVVTGGRGLVRLGWRRGRSLDCRRWVLSSLPWRTPKPLIGC